MNLLGKRLFAAFLLLGGSAGLATHHFGARQREALVLPRADLTRLEAELRLVRQQIGVMQNELTQLERETELARIAAAARESAPAHLWAARVLLMRQLLEEMPTQKIPELKLLTLLDWIQTARTAELDTANRIRSAFLSLRSAARRRFSEVVRPALRAFVTASGGELPADVRQLAPGVDATLLARYEMTRTGKVGAADEYVIREKPGHDATLQISLEGMGITINNEQDSAPPQSAADAAERLAGFFSGFDESDKMDESIMPFLVGALGVIVERYTPQIAEAFGDEPGEVFKAAAFRFRDAHPDTPLTHLGQLAPYFPDPPKFLAIARRAFVELEYFSMHKAFAPDADALAPLLKKPFDLTPLLQLVELKLEDRQLSMNMKWSKTDVRTSIRRDPDSSAPQVLFENYSTTR